MEYFLQREIAIDGHDMFTATEFITWKQEHIELIVFWGNDTFRKYNKLIVNRQSEYYILLLDLLNSGRQDKAEVERNKIIETITKQLNELIKNIQKIVYVNIDKDSVQNYNDLLYHLWELNPNKVIDYCPVNNSDLIVEWHNRLLTQRIDQIQLSSLFISEENKLRITKDFLREMLTWVASKIERSRKWYYAIYGNDGGNSHTKYPIKELKVYQDWLNNEISNANSENAKQEIVYRPALEDTVNIKETKTERLKEWLTGHGILNLPLVQPLPDDSKQELLAMLSAYNTPKFIAMLSNIGFIEHLRNNYFRTTNDLYEGLWKALNTRHELQNDKVRNSTRTIKGHILVLNPASNENRERFTSYRYLDEVKEEFGQLKK